MIKDLNLNWLRPNKLNDFDTSKISGQYLDFNISGQSLKEYLGIENDSSVTPLGWFLNKSEQSKSLQEFRLQIKPHLPNNRVELYICNECGDIGCGSVTAKIIDMGDKIVWTEFARQSDPDEVGSYFEVLDLEFERNSYFKALAQVK